MALHSKIEFAALCGLQTKHISTYVTRGKLVLSANDMIDDADPVNALFLAKRGAKADFQANQPKTIKKLGQKPKAAVERREILTDIEIRKKEAELKTMEQQQKLNDIKIQKASGELVPTEVVKMLFAQHFKTVYNSYEGAFDNMLQEMAADHNLSSSAIAKYRARLMEVMNTATKNAAEASKKTLVTMVNEYSEKRGKGEKINN